MMQNPAQVNYSRPKIVFPFFLQNFLINNLAAGNWNMAGGKVGPGSVRVRYVKFVGYIG